MNDPNHTLAYVTERRRRRARAGDVRVQAGDALDLLSVTGTLSVAFGNLGAAVDIELLFPRNVRAWIDTPNVSIGPADTIDAAADAIRFAAPHGLQTGDAVVYRAPAAASSAASRTARRTSSAGSTTARCGCTRLSPTPLAGRRAREPDRQRPRRPPRARRAHLRPRRRRRRRRREHARRRCS